MADTFEGMFSQLADVLDDPWSKQARPEQLPPPGDWPIWLILAGRGFGKTRTGAEWVRGLAESARVHRIALVGPTAADVRDTMIEGESGILAISPDHFRPLYEPSKRRIVWPNGVQCQLFSAEEPERLRGPQFGAAWADELAAWNNAEAAWDMLQFGMRLGTLPRTLVTTTPKPVKILKDLLKRQDIVVTRGSTYDNRANLAPAFFSTVVAKYEGTRLGRQELDGTLLEDVPGALWTASLIDGLRFQPGNIPDLKRIVVSVDPAVSTGEASDMTGVIVAAVGRDDHGYVLEDLSGKYLPHEWASVAVKAFHKWRADRIVAEKNQGGQMVESTLRVVDPNVPIKLVHASRGKIARAEPVSALYEQGRVHHVGGFPELEDQLCSFTPDASSSPDRLDALVWAFTELMLNNPIPGFGLMEHMRQQAEALRPTPSENQRPQPAPGSVEHQLALQEQAERIAS